MATKRTRRRRRRTRMKKYNQKCKTRKVSPDEHLEKKFKKLRCSPRLDKDNSENDYTCYNKRSLDKMKNLWNARHPDSKIKTNNSKQIWMQLKTRLSNVCNNERCWMEQQFMKSGMDNTIKNFTFAPFSPKEWNKNPNEWLSSVDILNVMKQYEKVYPCFEFMGPSPIDFDKRKMYGECVWEELCKFQLAEKIKEKKKKIGIIFNLDTHDKPGSHWVAMFINIKKGEIYYFDSYGDKTPNRIKKLAKRIQEQSSKLGKPYIFHENKVRHQYSNSECGMYCLYFIIKLIENKLYKNLIKKKIPDKEMIRLRNIYFNKV